MGPNARIGQIQLLSVHIEAPPDSSYESGADATVWLTLRNDGREADTLTAVSSPLARSAEIRWDDDCDGQAQVVPSLPLAPGGPVPDPPSAAVPTFDAYYIQLVGLTQDVPAGTNVPVSFTFATAGTVRVDVEVQPSVPRAEPSRRCVSSPDNGPSST